MGDFFGKRSKRRQTAAMNEMNQMDKTMDAFPAPPQLGGQFREMESMDKMMK